MSTGTAGNDGERAIGTAYLGAVDVEVAIRIGRTRLPIDTLLDWSEGSLLELGVPQDRTVDVLVDGEPFATGEVVTVGENYGVRVLELVNEHTDDE